MTERPTDCRAAARPTVLLADDNDPLRSAFGRVLREVEHWTVLEAADGREALRRLDRTVDVAVVDRQMPRLTGDEVVARLDETTFEGRVVVLSASEPDARLPADRVEAYLQKPVDADGLRTTLRTCV